MTNKQAFEILLLHNGYIKAAKQPSHKLDKWEKNEATPRWLGKAGALRVGRTAGSSHSITHLYDMKKVKTWAAATITKHNKEEN